MTVKLSRELALTLADPADPTASVPEPYLLLGIGLIGCSLIGCRLSPLV